VTNGVNLSLLMAGVSGNLIDRMALPPDLPVERGPFVSRAMIADALNLRLLSGHSVRANIVGEIRRIDWRRSRAHFCANRSDPANNAASARSIFKMTAA
jgi:hypothetical protein